MTLLQKQNVIRSDWLHALGRQRGMQSAEHSGKTMTMIEVASKGSGRICDLVHIPMVRCQVHDDGWGRN